MDRTAGEAHARALALTAAITLEWLVTSVTETATLGGSEYAEMLALVEWLCDRFGGQPPSEAERLFHLASIAVFQWARDDRMLVGGRPRPFMPVSTHILHGARRFPDEHRFKLAWLTVRHELQVISARPLSPGFLLAGDTLNQLDQDPRDGQPKLQDTLDALQRLADLPTIAHEVRLRRAALRFAMGDPEAAIDDLKVAMGAAEPFVAYLANLLYGLSLERRGLLAQAPPFYEAALRLVPASSATTALASAWFRLGNADAAAALLPRRAAADDPWVQYGELDYRFFPAYIAALRDAASAIIEHY
jgi:tetratricopeptide (TPR) repeat protein